MDKPLVSVIVPCYNHEIYIEQCILSIVNQTYTNIQLIVIDDGSKDNSFDIISGLENKYNFFAEKQQNRGLSKTINRALKQYVEGKYVIIIASDDYMASDRIEKQVKYFEENQQLGFVFGKAHIIDDKGLDLGVIPRVKVPECSFNTLLLNCYVPALTAMINSKVFETVGFYDEDSYIEDWDMWLRISDKFPFEFVDEYVAYYRLHGTNISSNYDKMFAAKKNIVNKWQKHPLYLEAINNVLLEEIAILSVIKKFKAITLMFRQTQLMSYTSFYKSLIKLFIKFKIDVK